ncbi:MAG: DsbA family protein [Lachnospiraceae bacterium]|nr:DsbA family protein [Lachnospiraceae bacterium]
MDNKIVLTAFTDPMMGLSYESEPIIDRLQEEYDGRIEIRYVMALLVRDVSDFMFPDEKALDPEVGISRYCKRLAGIYKSEESIGGLPINMDGFCLFDVDHRSSRPLCLAYKAAQLADPDKANAFLRALCHATVLECRPTTHDGEVFKVVRDIGIDEPTFIRHYHDGSAEVQLEKDLAFTRRMEIHSLPAYLFQCADKTLLMQSFDYREFVKLLTLRMKQESARN